MSLAAAMTDGVLEADDLVRMEQLEAGIRVALEDADCPWLGAVSVLVDALARVLEQSGNPEVTAATGEMVAWWLARHARDPGWVTARRALRRAAEASRTL